MTTLARHHRRLQKTMLPRRFAPMRPRPDPARTVHPGNSWSSVVRATA